MLHARNRAFTDRVPPTPWHALFQQFRRSILPLVLTALALSGCGNSHNELAKWVEKNAVQPYERLDMTWKAKEGQVTRRIVLKRVDDGYVFDLASALSDPSMMDHTYFKRLHELGQRTTWRFVPTSALGNNLQTDLKRYLESLGIKPDEIAGWEKKWLTSVKNGYLAVAEMRCAASGTPTVQDFGDDAIEKNDKEFLKGAEYATSPVLEASTYYRCRGGHSDVRLYRVFPIVMNDHAAWAGSSSAYENGVFTLAEHADKDGVNQKPGSYWFGDAHPGTRLCGFSPLQTAVPFWVDLACIGRIREYLESEHGVVMPNGLGFMMATTTDGLQRIAAAKLSLLSEAEFSEVRTYSRVK